MAACWWAWPSQTALICTGRRMPCAADRYATLYKLLAGASWMGEYGNPDKPEEWAYIKKYSPYHNLAKGKAYPEVYFCTSTRDNRIYPGHACKMAAKMIDLGYPLL
jgi:prolyl oligopeptidase PreP (S9A serine peptidase family)